jgi:hypothetical protein
VDCAASLLRADAKPLINGIEMNLDFQQGTSDRLNLPKTPGIYAEVCWPERGVRIGETGRSIRAKVSHDWSWFKRMYNGTAGQQDLNRPAAICKAAIEHGPDGFEAFLVSADPRLADKDLRQDCERKLFEVIRESGWADWNLQSSWR